MTPAELHDELHRMFGIGDWDDSYSSQPWYQTRMTEIAKLRAMLRSRRCTTQEVLEAARYAEEMGKSIHATWQVFVLVPEAKKYYREVGAQEIRMHLQQQLDDETVAAIAADENEWAERLARTPLSHAQEVLDQWRNR